MTLKKWRRNLLDLGLRNPLLNYRLLKARGVQIVGETSADVYTTLVKKQMPMAFKVHASEAEPEQPHVSHKHFLQTTHTASDLQKRLRNSAYHARTHIDNRGINTLFLALGMLRWYEPDGDQQRSAPLLLIPVTLTRENINNAFHIQYTNVDLNENYSLREKFRREFNLEFPPFPSNNLKTNAYFSEIRRLIRSLPKWSVNQNSISLGFFSFTKSLLYNDLLAIDNSRQANSLLADLLDPNGFYDPFSTADSGVALDSQLKIVDNHLVMDADSSQMRVLLDVRAGRDLVVQGPPGTGKSQTITNLIADAIGRNKTVLFVSEKMAALDVVKQRLDNVGIGDAALVLHSHRTTRHDFGKEIRRTLRLGAVAELADESVSLQFPHMNELEGAQKRLINYIESINRPIANYKTIYELHGRQLVLADRLAHLDQPQRDPNIWRSIADTLLRDRLPAVRKLERVRQQTGQLTHHPFGATTRTNVPPSLIRYITTNSKRAITQLQELQNVANRLTQLLLSPSLNSLDSVAFLLKLAGQASHPPDMHDINIYSPEWATIDAEALTNALEAQVKVDQYKQQYDAILLPEAWKMPALSIRQGLMSGKGLMRRFSADFRRARTQLAGLCHHGLPNGQDAQLQLVDIVLEVQRLSQQIDPYQAQFQRLFGKRLHERDWYELARAAYWLHLVHNVGVSSTQLQHLIQGQNSQQITRFQEQVQTAAAALEKTITDLWLKLGMPLEMALPFDQLIGRLNSWHTAPQRIEEISELNQLSADFHLYPTIIDVLRNWPPAGDYLTDWVEYTALTQLLDDMRIERPTLSNGSPHKSAEQFRDLDRAFLQHNRQRLAQQHWEQLPRYRTGGMAGAMHKIVERKRSAPPIRQFVKRYARALLRTKPIFMMSPLAIAAFLPLDAISFDLVIFDEASQIRPAEALGAIARARQFVIVGDSRQLPPTSFFESVGSAEYNLEADNTESILDLCLAQRVPERMLRWHYRSRHQSLIAIANEAFYDHKLVIFPSPDRTRQHVGLNFRYVPTGVYERGTSRNNPIEAQIVAQAVMHHARQNPNQTLGVATFSHAQRRAISTALEQLRQADSACEPFFLAHSQEPFFVKNLENVQGDERDVILISIGYGKGPDGRLLLNFGPLNLLGGERRLNVLTTRARLRCDVFANFRGDDLTLTHTSASGVVALKRYLTFAETGKLAAQATVQQRPPSSFEKVIASQLSEKGYQVRQRVGSQTMQVDLAVIDPDDPQRFLLGIECDADSYRAEATRDRDRIQGEVLSSLGWIVYRLYSADWWYDPNTALANLIEAIKLAQAGKSISNFGRTSPQPIKRLAAHTGRFLPKRKLPPYQFANAPIDLDAVPTGWERDKEKDNYFISRIPYYFDHTMKQFVTGSARNRRIKAHLRYQFESGVFELKPIQIKLANGQSATLNAMTRSGQLCQTLSNEKVYPSIALYDPNTHLMQPNKMTKYGFPEETVYVAERLNKEHVSLEIIRSATIEINWIKQVLQVENPIHEAELQRRIQWLCKRQVSNAPIKRRLKLGIQCGVQSGIIRQNDDFIWLANTHHVEARDRSTMPEPTRDIAMISNEEIQSAIALIVHDSIETGYEMYDRLTALLGLRGRPKEDTHDLFKPLLNNLVRQGKLVEDSGVWRSAETKAGTARL